MTENNELYSCLNCGNSEKEIPLVAIRFNGQENWICSQCLPILIHKSHQLTGKLQGLKSMPDVPVAEN